MTAGIDTPVAKVPFYRRRWVQIATVGILGLGIGGAAGSGSASTAQKKADGYKAQAAAADERVLQARADADTAQRDAANGVAQAKTDAAAALASQKAALDARTAELDAREKKITGAESAAQANTIPGEGTFLVGADIKAGTYRAAASTGCYWARLKSLDTSAIIDNNNADGPVVVTIQAADKAFMTSGCAEFHKIG